MERSDQPESGKSETAAAPSLPDSEFPNEPFACPSCGQMLAAAVRVCVACKRPIDVTKIRRSTPAPVLGIQPESPRPEPVRFSWGIFLIVFAVWSLAAIIAQRFWGPVKSQWVMGGAVIFSSAWVFYDAHERGVPKPLRWGLGSLLLWILVFPWYLARRKAPDAPCPFVEAEMRPLTRTLLLVLLILVLASAALMVFKPPSQ